MHSCVRARDNACPEILLCVCVRVCVCVCVCVCDAAPASHMLTSPRQPLQVIQLTSTGPTFAKTLIPGLDGVRNRIGRGGRERIRGDGQESIGWWWSREREGVGRESKMDIDKKRERGERETDRERI